MAGIINYFIRLSTALSQLGNAGAGGNPNRTISARCFLNRERKGWRQAYKVINAIYFLQDDHCRDSHHADLEFAREVLKDDER